ncbi:MAG: tubulin-like doman-containing protein [Haloplanus sp.]
MAGVPTYVVGAGRVGVEVLSALCDRGAAGDRLGLMAVDSDAGVLARAPSAVQTVHLSSDTGVVGEAVGSYPYLSTDVRIPDAGANGQRHVGRYKLDNPVSPAFHNHFETLRRRVERFYESTQVGLETPPRTYHLVVVAALGGGTGSGVTPLLAAMLDRVRARLEGDVDVDVRVFGVGVVPPLDFDPSYDPFPAPPVSYLNAYGALRNLTTLLDASADAPVEVPVYSSADSLDAVRAADAGDSAGVGTVFGLSRSPFDAYWLVSAAHGGDGSTDDATVPAMVAGGIRVLSSVAPDADHACLSRTSDVSPLGAMGYGAVTVPHRAVCTYCERTRERERRARRLERVVERNLDDLRAERDALAAALDAAADARDALHEATALDDPSQRPEASAPDGTDAHPAWFRRLRTRLDADPDAPAALVDADPTAVGDALDRLAAATDPQTHLSTVARVADGLADPCAEVRASVAETCAAIREGYDVELVADAWRSLPLADRAAALDDALADHVETCRTRRSEAGADLRDLLPPANEAFTSERERLTMRLDRLRADRDRLSRAGDRLDAVDRVASVVRDRLSQARERAESRLDDVDRDRAYFRDERASRRETLDDLDRELASLRRSLTTPTRDGASFVLPLRRDALSDLTRSTLETDLTSLAAYREHGLLDVDAEGFEATVADCHAFARGWPPAVTHHETAVTPASTHDHAMVRYHEANESCVADFVASVTSPDTLVTSSQSGLAYASDPFRIDLLSLAHAGRPDTLRGFDRLAAMAADGVFDAVAGPYREWARALAYPEWDDDVAERFE